jgi:PAS domain S-box-containing protein
MQDPSKTNQKLLKENALLNRKIKKFEQSETKHAHALEELRKLASVVRYSSEIIILTKPDGRMIFINEAGREKLGITEEDITQVNIMRIVPKHLRERIRQEVLSSVSKEGFWEGDIQYRNLKTGGVLDIHSIAYNIVDPETGEVQLLATVSRNITERKRIEEALKISERLLKTSQKLAKVGGWEWEVSRQTATWTDELYRIYDLDPADTPLGYENYELSLACYGQEEQPILRTAFQRCIEHGESYSLDLPFTSTKGRKLWIRSTAEPIMAEGRVVKVIGSAMDITDQKQTEESLKKSEQLLDATQKLTKVGGWKWDVLTRTATWTDETFQIYDIYPVEFPPGSYKAIEFALGCFNPEARSTLQAAFERCAEHGEPFDLQFAFTSPKGRHLWIRTVGEAETVEGRVSKVIGNIQDITDQKRIEEALKKTVAMLNATQTLTKAGGWEWDATTNTSTWTDELFKIHDIDPTEFQPGSSEGIERGLGRFGPEDRPVIHAAFQRCIDHGEPFDLQLPFITAKGRHLWVRTKAEALIVEGRVTKVIGSVMDITEQKRTEDALMESERILNATQKMTKVGGWQWDVTTQTSYWTDECFRIHDIDPHEFSPGSQEGIERGLDCFAPEDRQIIQTAFQRCVEHGEPYNLELPFISTKGRHLWIRTAAEAIMVGGRVVKLLGNFMDITEQKQAEQERESLIVKLQEALTNIKVLRGLLPICASCKKIRNDQGYWQQIESYIREHTDTEFSHAVCPECAKILYPEYYEQLYPEHD